MSNLDKLLTLGAQIVAGDLIWEHKVLGHFRNGDLQLTEEGLKVLGSEGSDEVKVESKRGRRAKIGDDEPEVSID